jgi:RNase P subunit RPR2
MDLLANRDHMKLLYGSPTTYCFSCHVFLDKPEKAHPRQHPSRPFQTVAYCDVCNTPPKGPHQALPKIQTPQLQTCASCEEFFSLSKGPKKFCSDHCAKVVPTDMSGATVPKLQRISSRKSCGACDCEDFHERGYCTMVAWAEPSPEESGEDLRDAIFEPRPKLTPRLLGSPQ